MTQQLSKAPAASRGETRFVLENVSWETFEALLEATGPDRGRMSYEDGTLEIMTPSFEHEDVKSVLGRLLEAYAQEIELDIRIAGSTTLKQQLKKRGVEPDESYYVQNEARIRGNKQIELDRDPPPDLVIEIQITRSALDKLGIYAALAVPEVWLWQGDTFRIHQLGEDGLYREHDRSRAFPGLPIDDLLRFVGAASEKSTTRLVNEFRSWVRENLVNRK